MNRTCLSPFVLKWEEDQILMDALLFQAIQEFKKGKVEFRVDKTGIVHLPFGKANFPDEDLIANLFAAIVCSFCPPSSVQQRPILYYRQMQTEMCLLTISRVVRGIAESCRNKQAVWCQRSILEKRTYLLVNGAFNKTEYKRDDRLQATVNSLTTMSTITKDTPLPLLWGRSDIACRANLDPGSASFELHRNQKPCCCAVCIRAVFICLYRQ